MISSAQWFLMVGALLLFMALTASGLKRLPATSAIIYLAAGLVVGPTLLNLFHFNPLKESALLEVLTEIAVLISLFSAGVKMPAPMRLRNWRAPVMLATVSMTVSVALVAAFGYFACGLPLGACILIGAILAPTDPVLATDVQIRHPGDNDRLRFTLTCEAGMNDGSAFPFVMLGMGLLGLHDIGEHGMRWVLVDVIWATAAGIAIGVAAGVTLAHIIWKIRGPRQQREVMDDFLGLGLIGVVYGVSVLVDAWGFLAVFAAAVALHQTEIRHARRKWPAGMDFFDNPAPDASSILGPDLRSLAEAESLATVSAGSLIFKEHLERLSEVILILLLGGMLFIDSWTWRAVGFALFVFAVARPVSVLLGLAGSGTSWRLRGLTAWFGVRGVGSLYYLMYAIQHGLPEPLALEFIEITLVVIALSILCHGISVKPLMSSFWRRKQPR
jgi:NhaP-type Na+/H+ or K+/H+ antiporter